MEGVKGKMTANKTKSVGPINNWSKLIFSLVSAGTGMPDLERPTNALAVPTRDIFAPFVARSGESIRITIQCCEQPL